MTLFKEGQNLIGSFSFDYEIWPNVAKYQGDVSPLMKAPVVKRCASPTAIGRSSMNDSSPLSKPIYYFSIGAGNVNTQLRRISSSLVNDANIAFAIKHASNIGSVHFAGCQFHRRLSQRPSDANRSMVLAQQSPDNSMTSMVR